MAVEDKTHSDIIYTYFRVEKYARAYGFRLACDWNEGVFRLYSADYILEASTDIFDMGDMISLHAQDQKNKLGL